MKLVECWDGPSINDLLPTTHPISQAPRSVLLARGVVIPSRTEPTVNCRPPTVKCQSVKRLVTARFVTEIFFPQRIPLGIDGRSYSPSVLEKIMYCAGALPAYQLASQALAKVGEISITGRHIGNLADRIGEELCEARDARTDEYFNRMLPRVLTEPKTPIRLATVSVDGGRIQTRAVESTNGVQDPHWRETKNALFMRMSGVSFTEDPQPDLPSCFTDPGYMKKLLSGLAEEGESEPVSNLKSDLKSWRPERLFRTCLSSLATSKEFGRMMEAEADSRGFYRADKQAFVGDGLKYNWSIQQEHFPTFTPILDIPHAIEYLYEAARALRADKKEAWDLYAGWMNACWQGRVAEIIQDMQVEQEIIGKPTPSCEETDARKVLADTITYLLNNLTRMDYPRYRREGLPITSAHMESLVKEIGYRVKGTEKFWNDGQSAESILQIRAATLSEDDRFNKHLANRPGNPYHPNARIDPTTNAAAA